MDIRTIKITRREMALRIFPGSSPRVAVNRLTRWINSDVQLRTELVLSGYLPHQRYFLPRQQRIFSRYFS